MTMTAIDMFAGLGGNSEGAKQAGVHVLWAGNHWKVAKEYHERNHPEAVTVCQDMHQAAWDRVPSHDLLMASPACTGHTEARGKEQPHHDAARSTAWAVIDAVEFHRPPFLLVENVPAFAKKWVLYPAWCAALSALGYALAPIIIDAADCGVPQHRKRLIVIGTRTRHPVVLDLPKLQHRPATEVIDFTAGSWSQVNKPSRVPATLARIARGRREFGDRFVMPYYGGGSGLTGRDLARPIGTITTRDRWAIVDGERMRMLTRDENRRAMAFPDDYQLPEEHKLAVHMLGNAVPPPMTREVITALRKAA